MTTSNPEEDEDRTVTISEKDLRDAWLRMVAVGDPHTAHVLWKHLTQGEG